jgi:hypothetical protein
MKTTYTPKEVIEYFDEHGFFPPGAFHKDESLVSRKGFIRLDKNFLVDNPDPRLLKSLFEIFFPIYTKEEGMNWDNPTIYYGVSPYFEPIEKGTLIPEYFVVVTEPKRGPVRIEFETKEEQEFPTRIPKTDLEVDIKMLYGVRDHLLNQDDPGNKFHEDNLREIILKLEKHLPEN